MESGLPFSHVDTEAFRKFALRMYPRACVKSAATFAGEKVPHLAKVMKWDIDCKLEDEFMEGQPSGIAIAGHIWSSKGSRVHSFSFSVPSFFVSLVLHYLSKDWKPMQFTIACLPVPEGGLADTGFIDSAIRDIPALSPRGGVAKVAVLDGANTCMMDAVANSQLVTASFMCVDSRLQSVIGRCLASVPLLEDLLQKTSRFASAFHSNPLTGVTIKSEADAGFHAFCSVPMPVAARPSSHSLTITSISVLELVLMSLRDKAIDIGVPHFSDSEMGGLKFLERILSEFEGASGSLAGRYCQLARVLTELVNLQDAMLRL